MTKDFGGFDPQTKKLQPMSISGQGSPFWGNPAAVLENIAGALEAGVLTDDGWVAELFVSPKCFEAFSSQLVMAGDAALEVERFSQALHKLAGCKQKQTGVAMLIYALAERGRKTGQVVDSVLKARGA